MADKILLGHGAEAKVWLENGEVIKERVKKGYRIEELDRDLRESRTKREAKLYKRAEGIVPKLIREEIQNSSIVVEHVKGELLEKTIADEKNISEVFLELGKSVGALHSRQIVHGDLTTANVVVSGKRVVVIDLGLSFVSTKVEDYAVDLHVFRQGLFAKHPEIAEECWNRFLEGYAVFSGAKDVVKRLEKVEKRGRYKRKKSES